MTFGKVTNFWDWDGAVDERHRSFGATISRFGEGILGFEGAVVLTPGFFESDSFPNLVETSRAVSLMGNVVLTTPRLWTEYSLRPFVTGGIGMLHVLSEDVAGVASVDARLTGVNIGAGAIGFLSDRTGVRFEWRYYSSLGRNDLTDMTLDREPAHLRYMTVSIGLVFRR